MRRTILRIISLLFCRLKQSRVLLVIISLSAVPLLPSVLNVFSIAPSTKVKLKHRDLLSVGRDVQTSLSGKAKQFTLRDNLPNGGITERNESKLKSCDNCNETIKSNLHLTQKDVSHMDAHIRGHESFQRQDTDGRINTCYNCSKGLALPKADLDIPDHESFKKTHFVFNNSTFPKNALTKDRYVCNNCFHFDFAPMITKFSFCNSDTFLLILIHSRPSAYDVRNTIRYTWASKCDGITIRCFFMLGNSGNRSINEALFEESESYNDIIQFDFVDSYNNLTYKTMVSFQWAAENCPTANYVLKTDDDSFINIKLLHTLLKAAPSEDFYAGGVPKYPTPKRSNSQSKWYVAFDDFPFRSYPKYCYGRGYVLSMDMLAKVVAVSKYVPFFFVEDIYTGLCVEKLDVKPVSVIGFLATKTRTQAMPSCYFNAKVFTLHKLSPKTIIYYWKKYSDCSKYKPPKPAKLFDAVAQVEHLDDPDLSYERLRQEIEKLKKGEQNLDDPVVLEKLRQEVERLVKVRLGDTEYRQIMEQLIGQSL